MNGVKKALVTEPIGLPRGTWSGPLSFTGEKPDPGQLCNLRGPYGTAVTAYPFFDLTTRVRWEPRSVRLRDDTARASVPGCAYWSGFLPSNPLTAGHVYTATSEYRSAGTAPGSRTHTWSFRAVGNGTPMPTAYRRCVRILRPRPAQRIRRHRRLLIRVSTCRRGRVTATLTQRRPARRRAKRVSRRSLVLRGSKSARKPGVVVIRLRRMDRLRRGRATITVRSGQVSRRRSVRVV